MTGGSDAIAPSSERVAQEADTKIPQEHSFPAEKQTKAEAAGNVISRELGKKIKKKKKKRKSKKKRKERRAAADLSGARTARGESVRGCGRAPVDEVSGPLETRT